MAVAGHFDALAHQAAEIHGHAPVLPLVSRLAGLEHLVHGAHQAIGIVQHQAIEFAALGFIDIATLQGLQIKPDGSDGGLQFVGDGIDEAVMLLVAANFTHQKTGVHDQPGDQQGEEDYAQEKQDSFAPVENDPADIQPDRQQDQANAQHDEKSDSPAAAADGHGRILPRGEGKCVGRTLLSDAFDFGFDFRAEARATPTASDKTVRPTHVAGPPTSRRKPVPARASAGDPLFFFLRRNSESFTR